MSVTKTKRKPSPTAAQATITAQVIGGLLAGSVALISDAMHNFSDFTALLISYIAYRIGRRSATVFNTFGYRRAEIMAALINVALLFNLYRGMDVSCGCFSTAPGDKGAGYLTVFRDLSFLFVSGYLFRDEFLRTAPVTATRKASRRKRMKL